MCATFLLFVNACQYVSDHDRETEMRECDSSRSTSRSNMRNEDDEEISKNPNQTDASSVQPETHVRNSWRDLLKPFKPYFNTLSILDKGTIGTGLFAMPYAFSRVGLFYGTVLFIGMALLIAKCLRLLLEVHRTTCEQAEKSELMYDQMVEVTLKKTYTSAPRLFLECATYFTNALLVLYYVTVASVCVDFIADVVRKIMKFDETNNPARYTLMFFPFFMILNLNKDLHDMALKSIIGNIFILAVIIIGCIDAFERDTSETWTLPNDDVFAYPRFIGIVFYSLSSPGLLLATQHYANNFEDLDFDEVLNRGITVVMFSHLFVGIVGYLKWGSNVSYNFINNIDQDANGYPLAAFVTQALAIYFTYGLQCYVPIGIVLKQYVIPAIEYRTCKGTLYLWALIVPFVVTLVSCLLPMFIPRLRERIAILGLAGTFVLTLLLPFILQTLLLNEDSRLLVGRNWKVIRRICFIVLTSLLALICLIAELWVTLKNL